MNFDPVKSCVRAAPGLSPLQDSNSPLSHAARQPLMLGLFLDLYQKDREHGEDTDWTFHSALNLVKRAEALGFDLAFSRAQWFPKGTRSTSLDAFLALAAMAPATERILLISSLHVLYGPWHPLHLAKFGSTLDHITQGRWGINILTGHRAVEHEMFGGNLVEHDQRYARAAELFGALEQLWSAEDNISITPKLSPWAVKGAFISPKPAYGRPVLVTATGSEAGIEFAARYSDLIFVTSPGGPVLANALRTLPAHIAKIKTQARALDREVKVLINPIIISAQSDEQAQARADEITRQWKPEKAFASDAHAWRFKKDDSVDPGRRLGGNLEIVGCPKRVVEQLIALKETGIDGIQIGFKDWHRDLEFFGEQILPLLKQAGLRL